jgi:O-antigen ligase
MYANLCAAYFSSVIPLAAGLGIDSWQQWQSDGNSKSRDRAIVLALGIMAISFSLLLTDSRSGWGIWVGIVTAFALYLGWRYLVMATAAATATIAWATWGSWGARTLRQLVPAFLWERLSDEEFGNRAENALRTTQWQFIFEMAQQRPILGFGLRNFTPLYKQAMDLWLGHPHSLPLMLLGETGIPGLFLFLGWVGWIGARGVCLCRALSSSPFREDRRHFLLLFSYLVAFASLGTYNLFDVTVFDLRMNLYGWLLLAAIAGIVQRHLPLRIHSSAREGG